MRRKKNLNERLNSYDGYLLILNTEDKNFNSAADKKEFLDYNKLFGNNNEVWLEVGCGKGKFIVETAALHPDVNYLAIEKSSNVIIDACELAKNNNLKNVKFIKCSAEYLGKYLPENSVSGIFLNFSCPYPKKSYASHRLTSERFLKIYKTLLKEKARIYQKTDNMHFFEFSIEQFSKNGYTLENISLDLHNSEFVGNVMTEYEEKFVNLGQPIYRLEAFSEEKTD